VIRSKNVKKPDRRKAPLFDAVKHLDNEEVIAEYLAAALEDDNPAVFLRAVSDVARVRGFTGAS